MSFNNLPLVVSQANELTILRKILCQSCKHKFRDATFDSSPFPAQHDRPTTSRRGTQTSIDQASIPDSPTPFFSAREVTTPKSSSPHISTAKLSQSRQGFLSSKNVPSPNQFGNTETTASTSSSKTSPRPNNPKGNSHFRWSPTHCPKADKTLDVNLERTFFHEDQVNCVKFSLDGKYIAIGLSGRDSKKNILFNGKVIVYGTETGKRAWSVLYAFLVHIFTLFPLVVW